MTCQDCGEPDHEGVCYFDEAYEEAMELEGLSKYKREHIYDLAHQIMRRRCRAGGAGP